MKKIKIEGKLNLNKETVTRLNQDQMGSIQGGKEEAGVGILSIGRRCTRRYGSKCEYITKGMFCNPQ